MVFLPVALALILLSILVIFKLKKCYPKFNANIHSAKFFWTNLFVGSAILLLLQLYIAHETWFIAGWDTRDVIFPDKQINSAYMSMYPNQIMLAGIFRRIYFIITGLGFSFDNYYFCLVILSTLSVLATVIFIALTSKKLTNNFCATVTFLFSAIFIGLSPWFMIPYSDTFAMFCTSLIVLMYISQKCTPLRWFIIIFTAIFGAAIKPTVIAVLLAIIFVEIVLFICKIINKKRGVVLDEKFYPLSKRQTLWETILNIKPLSKKHVSSSKKITKNGLIVKCVLTGLCAVIALAASVALTNKLTNYDVVIDKNKNFTATHFLMMGINLENRGAWNQDDVNISNSYSTVEDREAGNIKEWKFRLINNNPLGIFNIFLNKTLTNFSDGIFAWHAEKPWMVEKRGLNPITNSFYGQTDDGLQDDDSCLFGPIWHIMWLMVLIGCVLIIIDQRPSKYEAVISCSILAISAFLTLFEPDPRYLLLYLPYFCILAPKGWQLLASKLRKS